MAERVSCSAPRPLSDYRSQLELKTHSAASTQLLALLRRTRQVPTAGPGDRTGTAATPLIALSGLTPRADRSSHFLCFICLPAMSPCLELTLLQPPWACHPALPRRCSSSLSRPATCLQHGAPSARAFRLRGPPRLAGSRTARVRQPDRGVEGAPAPEERVEGSRLVHGASARTRAAPQGQASEGGLHSAHLQHHH